MRGRKTVKSSVHSKSKSKSKSRSRSRSNGRNSLRSKLLTGITKEMIRGNAPESRIRWGNIEGLTEENVSKMGFTKAMNRHKRMTAKKMHRYPNWFEQIEENSKKGLSLNESVRRLRQERSPTPMYRTHKNVPHHMTKAEKGKFYKEKAENETQKEKAQFLAWKRTNPDGKWEDFLSLRAVRKYLDKIEAE